MPDIVPNLLHLSSEVKDVSELLEPSTGTNALSMVDLRQWAQKPCKPTEADRNRLPWASPDHRS